MESVSTWHEHRLISDLDFICANWARWEFKLAIVTLLAVLLLHLLYRKSLNYFSVCRLASVLLFLGTHLRHVISNVIEEISVGFMLMIGSKVRLIALIEHVMVKSFEEATSKRGILLLLLSNSSRKDVVHLGKGSSTSENVLEWVLTTKYATEEVVLNKRILLSLLTLTCLIEREI